METCCLRLTVLPTNQPLEFHVRMDGVTAWQGTVDGPREITWDFDDHDGEHVVEFEMSGKTRRHTQVNSQGEIIQDSMLLVENVSLDGIDLGVALSQHSRYHHDFNGTGSAISDDFFGAMGCNGRVEFRFRGPVYLWLLENL